MTRRLVIIVTLVIFGLAATHALAQRNASHQPAPSTRWDRAVEAWEAGRYPEALSDLLALLDAPGGIEYVERIALLTGELFPAREVTRDGRNPRLSAGGRYVAYDAGSGAEAVTRIVGNDPGMPVVAEVRGASVVFDPAGTRVAWLRAAQGAAPASSAIVVRDLASGVEREWLGGAQLRSGLSWSGDGRRVIFIGGDPADTTRSDVYAADGTGGSAVRLSTQPGIKTRSTLDAENGSLVYLVNPARGGGRRGGGAGGAGVTGVIENLRTKEVRTLPGIVGTALTRSADGAALAWLARDTNGTLVLRRTPTAGGPVTDVRTAAAHQRLDAPALSPDGTLLAYQFMASVGSQTDWDVHLTDAKGTHHRITSDIQHDVLPRFLNGDTVLALIGEPRHRRAQLYDLRSGQRRRVFSNNTIRTISPEYVWAPSPDGAMIAIEADRDGDTVSPAHSVSVLDLADTISVDDLGARLKAQLAHETDLRRRMTQAFRPVADLAQSVVSTISPTRVYRHEQALTAFGSKYITQPGNARAIDYLERAYRSFGYTPELQWLTGPRGPDSTVRTANVVATLRGTAHPELIYVVSSHFDSVTGGPGADDNTSGTAALVEAARALAATPLPATVVFASFTGEEAGLLGSREFVRLAAERKWRIAGALNNDMIGWAGEGGRMDNTIRYSNPGIRDIQHGAAFLFTNLILYDAKYYRGTDAAAFYEGWGDIVGGIGSYPVLGNPNYHQPTDLLETINFAQVAETAKVTAATLIYLASSPSRLGDVTATRTARGIDVTWTPSPESDVTSYIVAYGPPDGPFERRLTVRTPRVTLPALPDATRIAVKAVNRRGLEGWDWGWAKK
jgi:hypothetical protein